MLSNLMRTLHCRFECFLTIKEGLFDFAVNTRQQKRARNWTNEESTLFAYVLADDEHRFAEKERQT